MTMTKLRFLCATHRAALVSDTAKAWYCCHDSLETGQYFLAQQQWQEALPYLGCAFETADIILTDSRVWNREATELFTTSAVSLMAAYNQYDASHQASSVRAMAVNRLQQEVLYHPQLTGKIQQYLAVLSSTDLDYGSQAMLTPTATNSIQ